MTLSDFLATLNQPTPPALGPLLLALWWDRTGDWEQAHEQVAHAGGREAAWVHAYLHRKEGDRGNAGYWYARAGRPPADQPLEEEWATIARTLLTSE